MTRATLALGMVIALVALSACGQRGAEVGPVPMAFEPQTLPDVPVPPGYAPAPTGEHLAVSYAGGALRRYLATYQQVLEDARSGDQLESWYRDRLQRAGWRLEEDRWPGRQTWRKGGERLLVETGRDDDRTIIRLTLMPAEA